jgi:hypothetical protein
MVARLENEEAKMNNRKTELVHVGKYVAKVEIDLIPDDGAWGPYVSMEDSLKIERVRMALVKGDLKAAKREAKVYELTPVAAE